MMRDLVKVLLCVVFLVSSKTTFAQPGTVIKSFPSPTGNPADLTFHNGSLWLLGLVDHVIYQIDTTNGSVISTIPTGITGALGLTVIDGYFWVSVISDNTLRKLDASGNVIKTVPLPTQQCIGIEWDGSALWIADSGAPDEKLVRVDTTGNLLSSFLFPGDSPFGLTWDGSTIWCANNSSSQPAIIYQFDPTTGGIITSFVCPNGGRAANGLAWDGQYLWIAENVTDMIYQVEGNPLPATGALSGRITDALTGEGIAHVPVLDGFTDAQGYFFLPDLPAGFYSLDLQVAGYHPQMLQGIQVQAGDTTQLQIALDPLGEPVLIILTESDGNRWQVRTYRDSTWRWQEIPLQRARNLNGGQFDSPIVSLALQPALVDTPGTANQTPTRVDSIVLGHLLVDDFESGSAASWTIVPGEPGSFLDTAVVSDNPGEGSFVLQLVAGNEIAAPPSHQLVTGFQPGLNLSLDDSLQLWIRGNNPQLDPTLNALDYYPLHVGDEWQYRQETWEGCPGCYSLTYFGVRIVGDTLMPNGKRYFVKKYFNLPDSTSGVFHRFERIDTARGLVLGYMPMDTSECTQDSLFARVEDTLWICNPSLLSYPARFAAWYADSVLGLATFTREYQDVFFWSMYRLSKGLGLSKTGLYELITVETTLEYARINGVEYGQPVVGIGDAPKPAITDFQLYPNYPNPFNPATTIRFRLPVATAVELRVFDLLGRTVKTLWEGELPPGEHLVKWDGRDEAHQPVSSGIYIYQLKAGKTVLSRKMLLLR